MAQEVVADVVLDVARGDDEALPRVEPEPAADAGDGEEGRGVAGQHGRTRAVGDVVDRDPQHPRSDELDGGRADGAGEGQEERPLVTPDVGKEPPQRRPGHLASIWARV